MASPRMREASLVWMFLLVFSFDEVTFTVELEARVKDKASVKEMEEGQKNSSIIPPTKATNYRYLLRPLTALELPLTALELPISTAHRTPLSVRALSVYYLYVNYICPECLLLICQLYMYYIVTDISETRRWYPEYLYISIYIFIHLLHIFVYIISVGHFCALEP